MTRGRLCSTLPTPLSCVMLNADRLDFDRRLNFDRLTAIADLNRHASSDPANPGQIAARVAGHHVVINKEMPMPREVIEAMAPSVKLICEAGTGFNNIDLRAARERGIAVSNLPTYSTEAMAHMTITFVLALSCSLGPQLQALHTGSQEHFAACHLGELPHFELSGKTIGLIGGLGTIGQRVAVIAHALGMRVLASSRTAPVGRRVDGIEVAPLSELLSHSDFVSIHCPLNAQTRGLVDAAALGRMKRSAFLINTARGAIIDEPARPVGSEPSSQRDPSPVHRRIRAQSTEGSEPSPQTDPSRARIQIQLAPNLPPPPPPPPHPP